MKTHILFIVLLSFSTFFSSAQEKLNIIVLGAHPDDADHKVGGTAIKFAKLGHNVLFVSVTNGDAGHYKFGGKELAAIRKKEGAEAGRRFGVTYKILDNHDGQLIPTLENRLEIIKLIREWKADVVIGHRLNDYHPDHRNAAILMQDAAYLVIVPNVAPEVVPLKNNPVFMYMEDNFQKPNPFNPDICVDITDVFEQKTYAMAAHESQYFDWLPWTEHDLENVPNGEKERLKWLGEKWKPVISDSERKSLIEWYGTKRGNKIQLAEAFEVCEYGRQPSREELAKLFPMVK